MNSERTGGQAGQPEEEGGVKATSIEGGRALVLNAGDRVLLTTDRDWSLADMDEARHMLADRFPDVEFTLINGVRDVVVVPVARETEG